MIRSEFLWACKEWTFIELYKLLDSEGRLILASSIFGPGGMVHQDELAVLAGFIQYNYNNGTYKVRQRRPHGMVHPRQQRHP